MRRNRSIVEAFVSEMARINRLDESEAKLGCAAQWKRSHEDR
jgi:hypothetical protein